MKKFLAALLCMTIIVPSYASQEERQTHIVQQLTLSIIEQDNVEQLQRLLQRYPTLQPMVGIFFLQAVEGNKKKLIKYFITQLTVDVNARNQDNQTPLMIASKQGNIPVVRLLLQHNADSTITDDDGYTALMHAAMRGHLYIVRMILEHNKLLPETENILNQQNTRGRTALWLALDQQHNKVARLLLKYGADPNIADKSGLSPLYLAATYDLDDTIELLLKAGASIDPRESEKQQTPLIVAAEQGSLKAVKALASKGASLNKTDCDGNTALLTASINGEDKIVIFLLAQGANTTIKNKNKKTALIVATIAGHTDVVRAFLNAGHDVNTTDSDGAPLLTIALANEQHDIPKLLLERGASVDRPNRNGQTPLMLAARSGDGDIVALLLEHGADPHARDNLERNALQYAKTHKHSFLVKTLRPITQESAQIPPKSTQTKTKQKSSPITDAQIQKATTTALWNAIISGDPKKVTQLLSKPFDATTSDELDNTLLISAIKQAINEPATRRIKVVESLLDHPAIAATLNTKNTAGETALMFGLDNPNLIQLLLEYNADPTITDNNGNTIIIRAVQKDGSNLKNILDLLKQQMRATYAILLNQQNNDGMSALMYAIQKNDPTNIKLLLSHGANVNIITDKEVTPLELAHQVLALARAAEEPDKQEVAQAEEMVEILQTATKPTVAPPVVTPPTPQKQIVVEQDPLFDELKKGSRAKIFALELILRTQPGDLSRQRTRGTTPLMIAIESNVPETVLRFILDKVSQEHVNLKQTTRPYESALTKAINGARESFVKLLLEHNASFDTDDIGLAKALADQAKQANQKRRVKRLRNIVKLLENAAAQQRQEHILLLAAHGGDVTIVDSTLAAGASINTQDPDGNTPLMRTIQANKDVTARHLIERGARLNIQNNQGDTALLLAVQQNNYRLVEYLLDHGADTKIVDNAGNTALLLALDKGYVNVANRIRIYQALQHLQKTYNIAHVLRRHYDPQGKKTTEIIGAEDLDVTNNPYAGRLDRTTASFFPRSWTPEDIQKSIEAIVTNPEQLDERPATINADGEMVHEALIAQGTYRGVSMKVIISKAPRVGWIVFTAYPIIPGP